MVHVLFINGAQATYRNGINITHNSEHGCFFVGTRKGRNRIMLPACNVLSIAMTDGSQDKETGDFIYE